MRQEITDNLRDRGVDVLTAAEDGANRLPDDQLLDRTTELGRVLFTQDRHLLQEAARRQQTGRKFSGVVYGHRWAHPSVAPPRMAGTESPIG